MIDRLLLRLGCDNYTEGGPAENYGGNENFEGVYGVFNYFNFQFIIGVWQDDPSQESKIYHRFDNSVCQAEMNIETGDILVSEAFLTTIYDKVIRLFKVNQYSQYRLSCQAYKLGLRTETTGNFTTKSPTKNYEKTVMELVYKELNRKYVDELQWNAVPGPDVHII